MLCSRVFGYTITKFMGRIANDMSKAAMYFGRFLMLLVVALAILVVLSLGSCSSFKPATPSELEVRTLTNDELDSLIRGRQREYAFSKVNVPPAPADDRTANRIMISCFVTGSLLVVLLDRPQ